MEENPHDVYLGFILYESCMVSCTCYHHVFWGPHGISLSVTTESITPYLFPQAKVLVIVNMAPPLTYARLAINALFDMVMLLLSTE